MSPATATVAALRTRPEAVLEDYDRLLELAGGRGALDAGSPTILKDNISWHFPFPAANTTPWQLEGSVRGLRARGFADLVCVQNKTVVTDAFKGEDLNGYVPIFHRYGIPVLYNFKDDDMRWVEIRPRAKMLVLDRIFPEGIHVPDYFFGKNIVHLPTVKCHIYTTTTGAMKNAFGGLLNTRRHYTHSWIHETLVDLLAIQREIHPGVFAIMDGTTAGNGPGPRTMYPVVKNVMLASGDQVAIGGGDLIWFGPLKRFQKLFFHTPLVNGFILASDVYHDFYRWPFIDRRVFERWCETTEWGQMFLRYAQHGPQGAPVDLA